MTRDLIAGTDAGSFILCDVAVARSLKKATTRKLEPHVALDFEKDTPELEAELLKAIDGPFAPYSAEEMKAIGRRVLGQRPEQ